MLQIDSRSKTERDCTFSGPYARCYDVATELLACLVRILMGVYVVIFLATPPAVTEQYLQLLALCLRKRCIVLAEKPWASCLKSALRLEELLENSTFCVRCNDHYLAKQVTMWLLQQPLSPLVGEGPISVKARLFEKAGYLSPAMGTTGVLHDLLIHVASVVQRRFPGERITVTNAFAARHTGWPYPTESYAALVGVIDTGRLRIPVNLAAGKDFPMTEKVMLIEGAEATLRIDFDRDRAELLFPDGTSRVLFPEPSTKAEKPYGYIFRRLYEGDVSIGLSIHEAIVILRVLDDAKQRFLDPLPTYQKGALPPVL